MSRTTQKTDNAFGCTDHLADKRNDEGQTSQFPSTDIQKPKYMFMSTVSVLGKEMWRRTTDFSKTKSKTSETHANATRMIFVIFQTFE